MRCEVGRLGQGQAVVERGVGAGEVPTPVSVDLRGARIRGRFVRLLDAGDVRDIRGLHVEQAGVRIECTATQLAPPSMPGSTSVP